jgi:hypothetical protein
LLSYNFTFLILTLFWMLLRTLYWFVTFNSGCVINVLHFLIMNIKFATFLLIVVFFANMIYSATWNRNFEYSIGAKKEEEFKDIYEFSNIQDIDEIDIPEPKKSFLNLKIIYFSIYFILNTIIILFNFGNFLNNKSIQFNSMYI